MNIFDIERHLGDEYKDLVQEAKIKCLKYWEHPK